MFVILLTYKKPLEIIDQYVVQHRAFLDAAYQKNLLVVSGPQSPRTGDVIISHAKDREQLENILKKDPFYIHELADYNIIEFIPLKYHADFLSFIGKELE